VGVGILAAVLIVAAGLFYRRWARASTTSALLLSLLCYTLSISIYELGYAAPLVFHLSERAYKPRARGLALFLIPAALYWVFRLTHANAAAQPIGEHPLGAALLAFNLVTSLPSNLAGFQAARNMGYGLWGLLNGSLGSQVTGVAAALILGIISARWIKDAGQDVETVATWGRRAAAGIVCAALLALPAAMVLVESRHSILASAGVGVAIAALAVRLGPTIGAIALALLLMSSQGLAVRQAEASQLQASVYKVIAERTKEIRSASVVVFDLASLADRVPYTWGEQGRNVLRSYWGIFTLSSGGFWYMVEDALYEETLGKSPRVGTCAAGLVVTETTVRCARSHTGGKPFSLARPGTLIIDFKAMPLPPSIRPSTTS
jgi:hypothetical protein